MQKANRPAGSASVTVTSVSHSPDASRLRPRKSRADYRYFARVGPHATAVLGAPSAHSREIRHRGVGGSGSHVDPHLSVTRHLQALVRLWLGHVERPRVTRQLQHTECPVWSAFAVAGHGASPDRGGSAPVAATWSRPTIAKPTLSKDLATRRPAFDVRLAGGLATRGRAQAPVQRIRSPGGTRTRR